MAVLAVTNTFTPSTTISSSQVNTNFTDIVNYVNARNDGSSTWDALRVTTSSAVVAVLNNSTGTANILNCQDNGSNIFTVADGGAVSVTATAGGTSVPLTVDNSTSTGSILIAKDNGTAVMTVADGGGTTLTATAGGTSIPLTVNNSTSTGNIFVAQDNGTQAFAVRDGGDVVVGSSGRVVFRQDGSGDAEIGGNTSTSFAYILVGNAKTATFGLASGTGVGLIVDNGTSTGDIFEAKDGGTIVFRIENGGNVGIGTSDFGSGSGGVIGIKNATAPSGNPSGGGVLYVESGALKYRGSSGTVTTLGNA